jgi:hypothetical protein
MTLPERSCWLDGFCISATVKAVEAGSGSFTIEFQEHVPTRNREVWLDRLKNRGAQVERQSEHVFSVHCSTRREIRRAGFLLLWPMRDLCSVIGTTGGAEARASAYQMTGEHLSGNRHRASESESPGMIEETTEQTAGSDDTSGQNG